MSQSLTALAEQLADSPVLPAAPPLVDLAAGLPMNPTSAVQKKFVGTTFGAAYKEAAAFVDQARSWHGELVTDPPGRDIVLDFGSGWGRITRMLLADHAATDLYCLDVDPSMTALIQTTLPGVNAITGTPMPPSVLGEATVTEAYAFSVFSHLSEHAHAAWAAEFGRLVAPNGLVFITTLEKDFLRQVRNCQKAVANGSDSPFHQSLAALIPDVAEAGRAYDRGEFIYGDPGADGPRTGDFYGWAAVPRPWLEEHWGAAGFEIRHWVSSGKLFNQAMVCLQRTPGAPARALPTATPPADAPVAPKRPARPVTPAYRRRWLRRR
jgi:Methyltransferase domain